MPGPLSDTVAITSPFTRSRPTVTTSPGGLNERALSISPPGDVVTVGLLRVKGEVIATVSDNGPGIPAENLETVFERFYTSRPKGAAFGGNSGLGLSIARQIAEAHGGHLRAENRTGADGKVLGALFILTLPDALP